MGCDIHLFVEKKVQSSFADGGFYWETADTWTPCSWNKRSNEVSYENAFYSGRNYSVFAALAGVRADAGDPVISEPRGLPARLSDEVSEEHLRWDTDAHSESFYYLSELIAVDWSKYPGCERFADVAIPRLKELVQNDQSKFDDVRIVFWFDN